MYFISWDSNLYESFSAAALHQLQLRSSSECLHSCNTSPPLLDCVCVCVFVNCAPIWSKLPLLYSSSSSSRLPSSNLPLCVLIFAVWPSPPLLCTALAGASRGRETWPGAFGWWVGLQHFLGYLAVHGVHGHSQAMILFVWFFCWQACFYHVAAVNMYEKYFVWRTFPPLPL